jgi:hypothetical protein
MLGMLELLRTPREQQHGERVGHRPGTVAFAP